MSSAVSKGAILGMGNPLLDISNDVDQAFLDKYEVKVNNQILAEDKHLPMYDELAEKDGVQYLAGGATQNSIRVAQWLLHESEGATSYIGCIGDDKYGKQLATSAKEGGVATYYRVDKETPTGTCACAIFNKERSLIANLAAANKYDVQHLEDPEIFSATVEKAKIIYSAGFFLTVSPASIMKAAEHAKANDQTFCMNLSAPFVCEFFGEPQRKALPLCNIVFGNETEAQTFAKVNNFDEKTDIKSIAAEIAKTYSTTAVITQGADQTVVAHADGTTKTYDVPKVPSEEIVDSNGAGDAFVGGYLAGLALGKSEAESVRAGHWAAGYVIRASGTQLEGKPDFKFE